MKRSFSLGLAVFVFFCTLVATDRHAWAYVDPGSGLLALQGLASALATCGYFFRRRIKTLFSRSESTQENRGQLPTKQDKKINAA